MWTRAQLSCSESIWLVPDPNCVWGQIVTNLPSALGDVAAKLSSCESKILMSDRSIRTSQLIDCRFVFPIATIVRSRMMKTLCKYCKSAGRYGANSFLSLSSPSKNDSARGGIPSAQLVLLRVSKPTTSINRDRHHSPYGHYDTAEPQPSARYFQILIFLEWHPCEILPFTRDMQTDLGCQVYGRATHQVRHILVHGIRWQPPSAKDQQTLDDRYW